MKIVLAAAMCAALAACSACKRSEPSDEAEAVEPEERCSPTLKRVCIKNDVVACEDGVLGRRLRSCHDGCREGRCIPNCSSKDAALIYVVDTAGNFMSFDPKKLPGDPFHLIGRLACPSGGTPFSMSVDRHGTAWVLYSDGNVFRVDIEDARCSVSSYLPGAAGVRLFGMGFVSDAPGSEKEKLYIAGADDNHSLGVVDTEKTSPRPKIVASIAAGAQNPELTGTADAKLYAFYPNTFEPAFVQEVDKTTGELRGTRWKLGDQGLGTVGAWAFAQWGGKFFIFVTAEGDSTVRMIDRTTGKYSTVMTHLPYRISGAGVSTCAPERDQ